MSLPTLRCSGSFQYPVEVSSTRNGSRWTVGVPTFPTSTLDRKESPGPVCAGRREDESFHKRRKERKKKKNYNTERLREPMRHTYALICVRPVGQVDERVSL